MSRQKQHTEVVPFQQKNGMWGLQTKFLKMSVGNYLGKSKDLTQQEAVKLAAKWADMQGKGDGQESSRRVTATQAKRSKFLKNWDVVDNGEEL